MPIVTYKARHDSPLALIKYVMNVKKTHGDEAALVTALCCSTNSDANVINNEMSLVYEAYARQKFYDKTLTYGDEENNTTKQNVRLHHYIQSFKPNEVSPEEAHRIGIEWAKECFGAERKIIVSTHVDKSHIHNHFVVLAYDDNGVKWHGNKTTLKKCKQISDRIAKEHGLSVIEHPRKNSHMKYGEWSARKDNRSWKHQLADEIDSIISLDSVHTVDDLIKKLKLRGYSVTKKKYISIKVRPDRKPMRSYRLGDGYSLEALEWRIQHKNLEMPLSEINKYEGIQREYAICLRQIQIILYREPVQPHYVSYYQMIKNVNLMNYIVEKNIHSVDEFKEMADRKSAMVKEIKCEIKKLNDEIALEEKAMADRDVYLKLKNKQPQYAADREMLKAYSYLAQMNIYSEEDFEKHIEEQSKLKRKRDELFDKLTSAAEENITIQKNLSAYLEQKETQFDELLRRAEAEQNEIRERTVNIREKHQEEISHNEAYYNSSDTI